MARSNNSRRVTHVPLTAVGSGARLLDLFPLPVWLFIPLRFVVWVLRHWYIAAVLCGVLFLPWYWLVLIVLSLPVTIYSYLYWHNRTRTPDAVARASLYLARARVNWPRACEAAELNDGPRRPRLFGHRRPPKIANDRGTAIEFTLNLARVGLTVKALEEGKDYVAATLDARRTRVHRITPGVAKFTIEWEKRLGASAVANPVHQINSTQLPRVELDQDVPIELDTSILVVGESGSGKSNLTWDILNELNLLRHEQVLDYRLHVIDPKKVELADLVESPFIEAYADNPKDADAVIGSFYKSMMDTFERMKEAKLRQLPLSMENPLRILVIDELLLIRQANKGVDSELGEILSAGRAAGHIVIANSQLGQVDAISRLRDLFPQRVCMAVKSADLTNAVLGPNAESRGARCSEIAEKGVGYVFTEYSGAFQRFKCPYIGDVEMVAQGGYFQTPNRKKLFGRV